MNEQHIPIETLHKSILESSVPTLIEKARHSYRHFGKGLLQLFYSEPEGYAGSAGIIYFPVDMNFEALLKGRAGPGPSTHGELFDYDEKRSMAICITYAGDNFFYRLDLPPDVPSFERAPVN